MGVVGQAGDEFVFQRVAVPSLVVVQELDLHLGHVDAGRAVAFAAFAANAQVERVVHCLTGESVFRLDTLKLTRERQAQRVSATARQVFFVARHAVAGAHGAGVKLAAVAVVVAHLDGFGKTLGRVAASPGRAGLFGQRIALHVPSTPVERRFNRDNFVAGRKAHEPRVVHFGRINHALRAEQVQRVHGFFDAGKSLRDLRSELPRNPFAPAQTVAVFAAVSAFELMHQR